MAEPQGFTDEERALFDRLNIGKAGGLPLPSFIRPSEVVAQARPLADAIFADWAALKALVSPHEVLLFDRWKSLKKRKRRDLLAAAWTSAAGAVPGSEATALPLPHRPDLVAWRRRERETGQGQLSGKGTSTSFAAPENLVTLLDWTEADRDAFLWPHISVDDLAHKTRPLWLLAMSRAAAAPDAFAAADLDTTRLGKACLALLPRYLNQYSMLFSGRTTPETYGELHTWAELEKSHPEKSDDPASDSFANRGTHPGEGLWILTIQARLYRFLVLAVTAVLGSAVTTSSNSNGHAGHGHDGKSTTTTSTYEDAPARSLEAPYRAPSTTLDLQALLDLVYAKAGEAEDHVWALRTDPAYFRVTLQDWAAHRKEQLSTSARESDNVPVVTAAIVDACLRRTLEQAETWQLVYSKVRVLAQQTEKHAAAVVTAQKGDGTLPRDVLLSFYALYYHVRSFENEPVGLLQRGAFASPPLRRHFLLEGEGDKAVVVAAEGDDAPPVVGGEDGDADPAQAVAVAIWALTGLQDDATRQLFGRQALLDELETAVRATREATTGVVSPISPWVADQVATLALYARATVLLDRFQPWAAAYDQAVQQDKEIRDILTMDFHMSMGKLRALLEHALGVAPPEFVNRSNSTEGSDTDNDADAAELATFWDRARLVLEINKAMTPRLQDLLARQTTATSTVIRVGRRTVDRRAARVYRALFHDPVVTTAVGSSNTPAAVTWPDIVHALRSAGFTAERLYASAWLFVPGPGAKAATRPSLFHEPWSGSNNAKLTPEEARWIGKRLNRAYGWDATTFVAE